MTRKKELIETIKVLRKEVEILTKRVKPNATGHIITAIGVINGRIDELVGAAIDKQPAQVKNLASEIGFIGDTDEDVYDGYKEHTEAMELSRLREIQDKAAGRSTDDYEHTKEYYDTQRNQPMEGENLPITEGLSNRSMKRRYGHAVMTTSEMMQDELEPLPINTFT